MTPFAVGDLTFALKRSDRRRTMEITVERDGSLILSAPPSVGDDRLRRFVTDKRFWVYTKLAQKDRLRQVVSTKQFVTGEGFNYLGRSYRLKLVDEQNVALKIINGRFQLLRVNQGNGREEFVRWYIERAKHWITDRVVSYAPRMSVAPAGVKVQDLGYRWGSCGKGDWLYFHWKTILLPPQIAEYVVVHEMAHLYERHHTPEFWLRVERAMPDFERRREKLAEIGVVVEGL